MSLQILATKLYIPTPRPDRVERPALIKRLDEELSRKLTLISAPAGFGKTSLLSEWIHGNALPVAWISLDETESDPVHFLRYLIKALQTIQPSLGASIFALLDAPQLPPIQSILTNLINEIAAQDEEIVLVLDDYHRVDVPAIHEILNLLLEHSPAHLHLVLTTRADPSLPLARLRSLNQLSEFRAADLSFTQRETQNFFIDILGMDLSKENIDALYNKAEGWVAGLQLAALSIQDREDVSDYIESFRGTDRHIVDYLAEEVLNRQPQHIQEFLLKTSILRRLTESLCDQVTRGTSTQNILNDLENKGLFIVPMDNQRQWYRYLHLFADLLRHKLQSSTSMSDSYAGLNILASQWYEDNGDVLEALYHAFEAADFHRVERLINNQGAPLYLLGEASVLINYLEAVPLAVRNDHPSLIIIQAWAMMFSGRNSDLESMLQSAEINIQKLGKGQSFQDLLGQIASIRGLLGINNHDPQTIITQSQRALELLDTENTSVRIATHFGLGYAYQLQGNLSAARESHIQVIQSGLAEKNTIYSVGAAISLGQITEVENDLKQAFKHYHHALELAGDTPQLMAGEAHLGLARVHYAWNDIYQARMHADKCLEFVLQIETGDTFCNLELLMARIHLSQDHPKQALASLHKATDYAQAHGFEHIFPALAQTRILILLSQGDIDRAWELAETQDDSLGLARVYLAGQEYAKAETRLAKLHSEREQAKQVRDLLDVLVLEILAAHGLNKHQRADQYLAQALQLSEASGSTRVFLDAGPDLQVILEGYSSGSEAQNRSYAEKILNIFLQENENTQSQGLADPLSQREMEVLQLIADGLSNQNIATKLFVSMSTVKTHLRNIYAKLEVHSRTAAIARAQSLNLL